MFGSSTRAAALVLATFFLGMAAGQLGGERIAAPRAWRRCAATRGSSSRWRRPRCSCSAGSRSTTAYPGLVPRHPRIPRRALCAPARPGGARARPALHRHGRDAAADVARGRGGEAHLGRRLGFVYALNTSAASPASCSSGFWLPVAVGVRGGMFVAAALNVGRRGRRARGRARPRRPRERRAPAGGRAGRPRPRLGFARVRGGRLGLGTLALEVLFTRLLVNAIDSSVYSFALVLATFLVSLALGSALVSRAAWITCVRRGCSSRPAPGSARPPSCSLRRSDARLAVDRRGAVGAGAARRGDGAPPRRLHASRGRAALCIGTVLPATWRAAIARSRRAGALVGRLTSLNTSRAWWARSPGLRADPGARRQPRDAARRGALRGARRCWRCCRRRSTPARRRSRSAVLLGFAGLASLRTWQIVPVLLPTGIASSRSTRARAPRSR